MIGKKFYKNQFDDTEIKKQYAECANWCNETQEATIEDKGEYYECIAYVSTPVPIDNTPSLEQRINDIELALMELAGDL